MWAALARFHPVFFVLFVALGARRGAHAKTPPRFSNGRAFPIRLSARGVCVCAQADDAREAAGLSRKRQKGEDEDAEATYAGWTMAKWNELENKEQKRRGVEIPTEGEADPKTASLPPGDETRGWHTHWRRGIYGALQSWAKGSRGALVAMLATCAVHFNVVQEVLHYHP